MAARILLIEDDPGSRDLVRALCEGRGDSVDTADDGFLGLRLLSERQHDIVLIDYHLPEMDGYALARLMREIARPEGKLRLVGVTADRHGLASRRGADTLFDAILVKPIEPNLLFSTLDQLLQPEPAPIESTSSPADELWRRRGLTERPKAFSCSALSVSDIEALSEVFRLVEDAQEADLLLVTDEAALDGLRQARTEPAGLLPSVGLSESLEPACDLLFRVSDPDAWTALANASRAFAARRADLPPEIRATRDAASRLLALLFVADRGLLLSADHHVLPYETGYSPTELMALVLSLAEQGHVVCDPKGREVAVALSEVGRRRLLRETMLDLPETSAQPETVAIAAPQRPSFGEEGTPARRPAPGWNTPKIRETSPAAAMEAAETSELVQNRRTSEELHRLIGADQVAQLGTRLRNRLASAFEPDAEPAYLAHQAHVMVSLSGSLGFDRLSERCRLLETAIMTGRNFRDCLNEVRGEAAKVRTFLDQAALDSARSLSRAV